ncbi:MAG: S4 domain-containing protein [Rhodanobacter sp.]
MSADSDPSLSGVRVDVWLWAARFFKTRRLSHEAICGGRVELNEGACKPSRLLKVGDVLRVTRGTERMEVAVIALSTQRGPASVAQALYQESDASRSAREANREAARLRGPAGPSARPNKSDRRLLRQLKHGG